jgi:hypothetical protein
MPSTLLEDVMRYTRLLMITAFLILPGSAAAQSEGTDKCQCLCRTEQNEYGGGGRMSILIHQSVESSICSIFNDRTCEISDPDTGEKLYGLTEACEPLSDEHYEAIKSPPK